MQREFLVTSTLASQAPAAVGRALSIPWSNYLLKKEAKFDAGAISLVSVGEGSINNAHFLSAMNLAKYSSFNGIKCPVVFLVTDNGYSISLKDKGWSSRFVSDLEPSMLVETADGDSFLDIFEKSKKVIDYSRQLSRPSLLLVKNLPRRFGHAATDRQSAYMDANELQTVLSRNPLSATIASSIQLGIISAIEFETLFHDLSEMVENAFDAASVEPKISSRDKLIASNSQSKVSLRSSGGVAIASTSAPTG